MLALPAAAQAQRSQENAVTDAEDAFGTNVGIESSGVYSEFDTRGFSPTKAGNIRIDGIYADTIGILAGRLRDRTAIRVGFSAQEFPFAAPTGIVDHKFRSFPQELGGSLAFHQQAYGGWIAESDFRLPVIDDRLSLTGGIALSNSHQSDGSGSRGKGFTLRPILRFGGVEIAPYATSSGFRQQRARVLSVVTSDFLPRQPALRRYLGQDWALGKSPNRNFGITVKAPISSALSLRGGLFHSRAPRERNFTEIYAIADSAGTASHRLIADPAQRVESLSGEVQVALRLGSGRWQHRLIAGFRGRNRLTETGGSVVRNYVRPAGNPLIYGERDPQPEENFTGLFSPVNAGRVKQSALLLGYLGKLDGIGTLNLGIQKARYRGTLRDGRTGLVSAERDDPWLYNATLGIDLTDHLSIYAGTQKGLEDSGVAPENAANRNDQLPPTRSTQYEGGVRWKFPAGQLVVNLFQITKPYFTFDSAGNFIRQGNVRHRGVESSFSGHFGKRLNVLAGAVLMQPRVTGGLRPAGVPSLFARADINYRTDIFGGLTPTASLVYTGSRAVGARALTSLGGEQLEVAGYASIDFGLRQSFKIGMVPASIRFVLQNAFDTQSWRVVAANTIYAEERRRFTLSLAADL